MHIPVVIRPIELPPERRWPRRPRPSPRMVAIGDIHGRWDLLQALVQALDAHMSSLPEEPSHLVILGDFIDRGPDSRQVIEFLRTAQEQFASLVVLCGNHEASLLSAAAGDAEAQRMWIAHGGTATMESFGVEPQREGEDSYAFGARLAAGIGIDTLDWLGDLPLSYHSGRFFFCHAGVRPGRRLSKQEPADLLWIREDFVSADRDHGAIVVHGHSIVTEAEVRPNRIGLDTGAYASGVLTAAILGGSDNWIASTQPTS